jgi:diphthamide biosynthesis protein 2
VFAAALVYWALVLRDNIALIPYRMEDDFWDLAATVNYIVGHGFKRVALQFPDDLLIDAPVISQRLSSELSAVCDAKVYILADTSYNSTGVDEVAAQHIQADCVVGT